ncbi:MAG: cytochrome b/b6 domain-containing protein [Magnetococcales bacterium]|nr:cytochrome b/b6 domain-containing protein [Magnetococcales bacterium]
MILGRDKEPPTRWKRLHRYFRTCAFIEQPVWDRPTRFTHWALTGLLIAALITGWFDPAWQLDRHLLIGGMIAGLLLFRFLWGLLGPEFSRFTSFFSGPRRLQADVASLLGAQLKLATPGLNPANGWVSLLILLNIVALIATGLMAYGGEEHLGPLAALISFQTGEQAQRIHEWLSILLMVLVLLHFWIIQRETRLTRVPLIRSMITGCKPLDPDLELEPLRHANPTWAILLGMILMFFIDHTSKTLGQLPLDGWRPLHYPTAYQEKCGSCHWTIHPSLMPEERWRDLLHQMSNHFGQKVILTGQEALTISSFILIHAAEDWNTDAANRFRKPATEPVQAISDHPLWRKIHTRIEPERFRTPPVNTPTNCPVCHHDALSGRFDRHAIHLPSSGGGSHAMP